MQEDPSRVLPLPATYVPQMTIGELYQTFQVHLIAGSFFLLNPDGLAVTPNLDHNLKLANVGFPHLF